MMPSTLPIDAKSREGRREAIKVLSGRVSFVDAAEFHQPNAFSNIFCRCDMPAPDTSWFKAPRLERFAKHSAARFKARSAYNIVLTKQQEHCLFLRMNYARMHVKQQQEEMKSRGLAPIEIDDRSAGIVLMWHAISLVSRRHLSESNLALVVSMAANAKIASMIPHDELLSEANAALLRAIDAFDVNRGFKFSTYACNAIAKAFSHCGMEMRRAEARARIAPLQVPKPGKAEASLADAASEIARIVDLNLAGLSGIELDVIRARFGFGSRIGWQSLEQVRIATKLSKRVLSDVYASAMKKIELQMRGYYLGEEASARAIDQIIADEMP